MNSVREGYKMTELGEIPSEWEVKKLKELLDVLKDGTHNPPKRTEEGIPLLSAENIFNGKINYGINEKCISEEDYELMHKNYSIEKDDILMTIVGTIGRVAVVKDNKKFAVQRSVAILRSNKKVNNLFLTQFLSSTICKKELDRKSNSTAQAGLYLGELGKINIIVPSIKEQEKIASILSTVDEQIDNVNVLIEKNKELKKGLMQTLLTKGIGHTKFKKTEIGEIPEEWEVKRIEEICQILDSKRIPLNEKQRSSMRGNIPYYGANAIVDYVNEYLFNDKLILIAEDGGNFSEFRDKPIAFYVEGKCWVNNHAHVLKANNSESTRWIFYNLVHKDITNIVQGGTRAKLNQKDLRAIAIAFPKLDEQIKIVNILSDIDKKIEIYISKKDKLKQLKKGLMQKLLTGKIRTVLI